MNKKSKRKKKFLIVGITIAVIIYIIYLLLLFFLWCHRNGTKYNDSWIMGKTVEQIEEKYGEFDYVDKDQDGNMYKATYKVKINGFRVTVDNEQLYYVISFNKEEKAEETSSMTQSKYDPYTN